MRAWSGAALAAFVFVSSNAYAAGDDVKLACARAHEQAQIDRRDGKFREAKKQLLACMQDRCPLAAEAPCKRWYEELDASMPTIVARVFDREGSSTFDAKLLIDGEVVDEHVGPTAIEVDPGKHVARFELAGAVAEREFTIVEGQKNMIVEARFAAPAKPATNASDGGAPKPGEDAASRPIPTSAIVFGGVGVVGVGAFAILGATGLAKESSLRAGCAPGCDKSEVSALHARYVAADVSLGVGVAAIAAATILFVTRPSKNVQLAVDASPRARFTVAF